MEEKPIANASPGQTPPARKRLEFTYDSHSRRIRKTVYQRSTTNEEPESIWILKTDHRFVYDAWNLLAEINVTQNPDTGTFSNHLQRSYAWGYDLSGSEQGAGGVGALVLVKQSQTNANLAPAAPPPQTGALAPLYDGNGNIHAYLDCATGAITQRMEYDAFGNEMTLDSVLEGGASTNREVPFRFSTKYTDSETALSYYGYRYYSAEMGRWLNRDPIEEKGGVNLYSLVGNQQLNKFDYLGLRSDPICVDQMNAGNINLKGAEFKTTAGLSPGIEDLAGSALGEAAEIVSTPIVGPVAGQVIGDIAEESVPALQNGAQTMLTRVATRSVYYR